MSQGTWPATMNKSQDPPLDKNPTLYWVLCSKRWEDIVLIAVPELNTILIESNYLDISTQEVKRSYFDWLHNQCWKSWKKSKRSKERLIMICHPSSNSDAVTVWNSSLGYSPNWIQFRGMVGVTTSGTWNISLFPLVIWSWNQSSKPQRWPSPEGISSHQ